ISGNCLVHQFVSIGTLAMMQGGAGVSQDLPPFCVAAGVNELCGLNTVGLRRAGISSEQRLELRRVYQALFRRPGRLRDAISCLDGSSLAEPARRLLEFVRASKRGVCSARHRASGSTDATAG
ncbi:MAG TPA: acyl-[acyl-carrier-protein]--UDP-N-acetylglucosamine O-acyltransferase, partial [Verrucomicrobiae bacterium]|nr:acyl-[acyl-carrier-protein]--UDP-N-acetylglucosamine O-acyltransferase [Verrucomicrobiae bacterium]